MIHTRDLVDKIAFFDGSLRDIYIFDTNLNDWNLLIKFLRDNYDLETNKKPLPDDISNIIYHNSYDFFLLNIKLKEKIIVNCHFYINEKDPSPIEFDIDPREIKSEKDLKALLEFIREIGGCLLKNVFLTEENFPDFVLLSYIYKTDNFIYHNCNENLCVLED